LDLCHQAQVAVVFDKLFPAIEVDVGAGLEMVAEHGLQARLAVGIPDRIDTQPFKPPAQHQTLDTQQAGVFGRPDYRVQPVKEGALVVGIGLGGADREDGKAGRQNEQENE